MPATVARTEKEPAFTGSRQPWRRRKKWTAAVSLSHGADWGLIRCRCPAVRRNS